MGKHMTPRMFLAKEMRRVREEKGLKPTDVAKEILVSEGLIRAWEKGRRIPQPDDLSRFEAFFDTKDMLGRLREDLIDAAVPVEWFERWPDIEYQSTTLWSFEPLLVPGLLQGEEYARAVLRAAKHLADTEEMVSARLERQKILEKDDAPLFISLLDQSVLQRAVGSAMIMRDQLNHLVKMAGLENVIVQIIPLNSIVCSGFLGGFMIASFDGGNEVAYVDNQLSGEVVEYRESVTRLRRMFETFRADALSQGESVELIAKWADKWT
jgi:transcriptional regulator with XRE-family HTH domain